MNKTPDQELYDLIFKTARSLGYTAYTHNPPDTAEYPFVHVGRVHVVPDDNKSKNMSGTAFADVNVWGAANDRALVSRMAYALMREISKNRTAGEYSIVMKRQHSTCEVIQQSEANDDLWRAMISLEFVFA